MEQRPVCLTIGGSDSCGGAGIQADLRVFEALNVHGCSAITALTAQNPNKISHIQGSSIPQFEAEIQAIFDYYPVQSIKVGMMFDAEHLYSLTKILKTYLPQVSVVVDPVLIASSGRHLFQAENSRIIYQSLIEAATIWTPNLQEASFFLEQDIQDPVDAASSLLLRYKTPVLLKGGHGEDTILRDVFCDLDGSVEIFEHQKLDINIDQTHGTGCRLASAIAAYLSPKHSLFSAVQQAQFWLQNNLRE